MFENPFKDHSEDFIELVRKMENKYKQDYRLLRNLEGDLEYHQTNTKNKFYLSLAVTWGTIWYKQCYGTPVPFFRKFGRVFGTHRVFRLYSYSFAALYSFFWIPYNSKVLTTIKKIEDTDKIRSSGDYENFLVDGPQQLDFSSQKIMPWKSIN
jgi:hypothetical protein